MGPTMMVGTILLVLFIGAFVLDQIDKWISRMERNR